MFDFLTRSFSSIFTSLTGNKYLSEKNIDETLQKVRQSLLDADVPFSVVETFIVEIKSEVVGKKVLSSVKPSEQFIKIVQDTLVHFLGNSLQQPSFKKPAVVLVMGLQGSGKTTTVGKLVHWLSTAQSNAKIVCSSVDFYRPAAVEQLAIVAQKAGALFYCSSFTDPITAARDCVQHFKNNRFDYLLLDTAGRMHIDSTMLQELQSIVQTVEPQHKILVLDAMTGQESLRVAQAFDQAVGFEGAVLTKLDSETRAGCAFAFCHTIKKPILFVGTGEKSDDFELFKPDRMAGRILGMGDLETLLESANKKIKESEHKEAEQALLKGNLTLEDFGKQLDMMGRMGSFGQLLKYIPGMGAAQLSPEMIQQSEQQIKHFKAIISSMTLKERKNASLLNGSRKKRIAAGAGVPLQEVNVLLERFEKTQQFVKLFSKTGRFPGF